LLQGLVMRAFFPVLYLALHGCSAPSQASEAAAPPANEVWITSRQAEEAKLATGRADDHDVGGTITTSGRLTFDDLHVDHVFSPVTGRVTRIDAQLGEHVKKGQALAVIDSPDLGMASADLAKAEADLIAAEHDYNRQKELAAIHAVAQRDYETAEDNYRKARAEVERARQKGRLLNTGNVVGQGFVLRAHIDGEVVARTVNPGMEVQGQYSGGAGVELFTVGEVNPLWVVADAFEMDIARIKPGEHVKVKVVAYPEKVFEGVVEWVASSLDPATRTAKVRCTIPNPERLLKPEMFATVAIGVEGKKRLAVPRSAVLHLGEQTVVFVPAGQTAEGRLRFERRPVSVDEDEAGDWVPVTRGVQRGEEVVTSGAILLSGA
jgi:cobalt-zinc-cadmium efflux system membrane fusion protein